MLIQMYSGSQEITHLNRQETFNYVETARTYEIDPITLTRRHKSLIVSRVEATLKYRQRLNNVEEDTFLDYIDSLIDRHILPTIQIIKNLVEEILKESVEKN